MSVRFCGQMSIVNDSGWFTEAWVSFVFLLLLVPLGQISVTCNESNSGSFQTRVFTSLMLEMAGAITMKPWPGKGPISSGQNCWKILKMNYMQGNVNLCKLSVIGNKSSFGLFSSLFHGFSFFPLFSHSYLFSGMFFPTFCPSPPKQTLFSAARVPSLQPSGPLDRAPARAAGDTGHPSDGWERMKFTRWL